MERREFITRTAVAAGLATVSRGWAQSPNEDKLSHISIMVLGFNSIMKTGMPASPERTLDIMDIGQLCADRYHVHNIELQSNHIPSTEMSWLKDFRTRLNKTKTRIAQINLEFGTGLNITADSPSGRLSMIDLHRVWLDRVVFLGCPRVLVNQGQPTPENKELAIANYKALIAIAKPKNVKISSENHPAGNRRGRAGAPGGQAAQTPPPPQPPGPPPYILLTEILKAGGAYTCCDFLNFANQDEQLEGIRRMLPITSGLVHAGLAYDVPKAMALARELGYKGMYSIKCMGQPGNPLENVQQALDAVLASM